MIQINPYIGFGGRCREAMTFYKDCLGGELTLQTVAETPIAGQCPAGMQDQVMHSMLMRDGVILLMGTDMAMEAAVEGNTMMVTANCSSEAEIDTLYAALGKGGKILDDLKMQWWGGKFGMVMDRFGTRWALNWQKEQA